MDVANLVVSIISIISVAAISIITTCVNIRHNNKIQAEMRRFSAKPWIYSIKQEISIDRQCNEIIMRSDDSATLLCMTICVKNTDNGVGIVESIKTSDCEYFPTNCTILDKNSVTKISVYCADKQESLCDIRMYIRDVYGNKYTYDVHNNMAASFQHIEEVTDTKNR